MNSTVLLQTQPARSKPPGDPTDTGLLLQRKCACGKPTSSLTGECADCKKKRLQTKLTVGATNDPLEQDADRVADQVMAAPKPSAAGGAVPWSQLFAGHSTGENGTVPASVDRVLASPGHSLDPALQKDMGQRFGHDFSRVRVHVGTAAEQSAKEVSAHAYTVGQRIVFGAGRFAPQTRDGRRLIAHELAHVIQQSNESSLADKRVAREADEDEEERRRRAGADQRADAGGSATAMASDDVGAATTNPPTAEAGAPSAPDQLRPAADAVPAPAASANTNAAQSAQIKTPSPQPAAPTIPSAVTPGGHAAAPIGMASCPDAPGRSLIVLGCSGKAAIAPPAVEKAELPQPNPARLGGDADRAKFAKELAQCHAARIVNDEVEKRYRAGVTAAKKQATDEAKSDTEAAIKAGTEGIDPKDKSAVAKAKAQAAADAKKAASRKIANAQAAVTRQGVPTVSEELAAKLEDALAADYDETIAGALARFGPRWLSTMQSVLNKKRKQITMEKNAKPKVAKGETPQPPKSADQIASEIESEMVEVRCDQRQWVLGEIEAVSHAWAVGRREQVDFQTIPQKAASLSKFTPTYNPDAKDRVDIPMDIQQEKGMPGVAPEMSAFLTQLKADPSTPPFKAGTYGGHGGGSWAGKGFSVDLTVTAPTDQRGFWQHSTAVTFLLRLDATAKALGARWRVLYDDFRVAQEVNAATGTRNVGFVGESDGGKLNWHGPAPLILHFHLDLEIPQKPSAPTGGTP